MPTTFDGNSYFVYDLEKGLDHYFDTRHPKSFVFWVNAVKMMKSHMYIICKKDIDVVGISMGLTAHGQIWYEQRSMREYQYIRTVDEVANGIWNHIVITDKGTGKTDDIKIYVNGVEATTTLYDSFNLRQYANKIKESILNLEPIIIGGYRGIAGWSFIGELDDIKIFNYMLKANQVSALYKKSTQLMASALPTHLVPFTDFEYREKEKQTFRKPTGVSIDSSGRIYVADSYNHRIQIFDSSGKFLGKFGKHGLGEGEFRYPTDVAISDSGNIYVVDMSNHRVQIFDSSGRFLRYLGQSDEQDIAFNAPRCVVIDQSNTIYVSDLSDRILIFDSSEKFLRSFGKHGEYTMNDGEFKYTAGISIDNNTGRIFVVDSRNNRIQIFDSSGKFLGKFGKYGTKNGQFKYPYGISIDISGNVYVSDTYNHRIQIFDSSGKFLGKFGKYGLGKVEFRYPRELEIDSSGQIVVADTENNRIQIFDHGGSLKNIAKNTFSKKQIS